MRIDKKLTELFDNMFAQMFVLYNTKYEFKIIMDQIVVSRKAFCEKHKQKENVLLMRWSGLNLEPLINKYKQSDDDATSSDLISTLMIYITLLGKTPANLLPTEDFRVVSKFCSKNVIVKYISTDIGKIITDNYNQLKKMVTEDELSLVDVNRIVSTDWYDEIMTYVSCNKDIQPHIVVMALSRFITGRYDKSEIFNNPFEYGLLRRWTKNNSRLG